MIQEQHPAPLKSGHEETRLRLLAAARELFAQRGSRGTTTREVAERAGVNEATLFRHFGTKHQLLDAMREHFSGLVTLAPVIERLSGPLETDLRVVGLSLLQRLRANEDLIRMSLAEEYSDPDGCSTAWRGPMKNMQLLESYMNGQVRAGRLRGDPGHLASLFATMMFGYAMGHQKFWRMRGVDDSEYVEIVITSFLKGALP
jgi:AcrR family transcriptional regulator